MNSSDRRICVVEMGMGWGIKTVSLSAASQSYRYRWMEGAMAATVKRRLAEILEPGGQEVWTGFERWDLAEIRPVRYFPAVFI